MSRLFKYVVLIVLGVLALGDGRLYAEDFRTVAAGDLKSNPKQYWATGIIFKDVLTAYPAGKKIQIENEDFVAFQTRTLGVCYADAPLAAALMVLPLDREYLFRGTVLTRSRFIESAGRRTLPAHEQDNLFMVGMLSMLDVVFGLPLAKALAKLPLPDHLTRAILGYEGQIGMLLSLAEA
ncbi:MAG TPA: hypothetical protein PKK36_06270, partial [Kiritimatiellia bacterium]|nr:hypothetical protein [Kiritimatiellia bacterium]